MEQTTNENTNDLKSESLAVIDVRQALSVDDTAKSVRDDILEGRISPCKAGIFIKRLAKLSEILMKDNQVKAVIKDDTEKYLNGAKSGEVFGAKISIAPTYTYYNFKECGHPVLDALYIIQEDVKQRIELLEEELKLLIPKNGGEITPNLQADKTVSEQGEISFGIKSNRKSIIVEDVPQLTWIESGEVAEVAPPKKIQQMGIKYMKV